LLEFYSVTHDARKHATQFWRKYWRKGRQPLVACLRLVLPFKHHRNNLKIRLLKK
jgi:hypothetical protein